MCAIINVLEGFLRGYIGAMLVLRSDGRKLAIFSNSWKVDFCDTSAEISMILKWAMKNIENPELSIVQKPLFFVRVFAFLLGGDQFWQTLRGLGGEG